MWEEEKVIIKNLVEFKKDYKTALNYIDNFISTIFEDDDKNRDVIYYCLLGKALCYYNLQKFDEALINLENILKYALIPFDFIKIDWTYGLCYENIDKKTALYYYDKAESSCCNRIDYQDMISLGQIKCTRAMLLNDISLMEDAVQIIVNEKPTKDILDTAYNSLCTIYFKNNENFKAFSVLKKITDKNLKKILRSKILI